MTVRKLIREQAAKLPATAAPGVIASAVIRALPDDEVADALRSALPYLVRDELRKIRHTSLGVSNPRATEDWRSSWPEQATPANLDSVRARRAAGRAGFDAAQARRDREAALLATKISLAGKWKALGDCTPADLHQLADENHRRAEENTTRATSYERLAHDMQTRGIKHVRDYPDVPVIREAFAHAA